MIQMIFMKEVIILILLKNNIPVIFFFSGVHEDYHGPGDTYDKIRYDLLTKRARLIFHSMGIS